MTNVSMFQRSFLSVAALALLPFQPAHAQSQGQAGLPAILSDAAVMAANPLPDFSYAGYEYGIGMIPHFDDVINVSDYGAIADDDRDDSVAILAAIAAASERKGPVRVQFGKGRYQLSEIVWLERSNIVLAGAGMGPDGTEIYMPRPLGMVDDGGTLDQVREAMIKQDKRVVDKAQNLNNIFSEFSWNGGFIWTRVPKAAASGRAIDASITTGAQFSRTMTVAKTAGLKVGDVVKIQWFNREGPGGPLIKALYGETDQPIGKAHWVTPDRPVIEQPTRIEAISGNLVTIADPLLLPISDAVPANFASWNYLTNVGIEDIAFVFQKNAYFGHHLEAGYNAIMLDGIYNGWVRNIRVAEADAGILTSNSANLTISNVVTEGDHRAHYTVHIGGSHNVLVDGLTVFNPSQHSLSLNTRASRSVYKNAVVWNDPILDQHSGANQQNLFDNVTVHLTPIRRKAEDGSAIGYLFRGGGASNWYPGHARYNTTWNLNVLVAEGVPPGRPIVIQGPSEGPAARIVGMHGNRPITLEYVPQPYVEMHGKAVLAVPSLYDWQLAQRLRK